MSSLGATEVASSLWMRLHALIKSKPYCAPLLQSMKCRTIAGTRSGSTSTRKTTGRTGG